MFNWDNSLGQAEAELCKMFRQDQVELLAAHWAGHGDPFLPTSLEKADNVSRRLATSQLGQCGRLSISSAFDQKPRRIHFSGTLFPVKLSGSSQGFPVSSKVTAWATGGSLHWQYLVVLWPEARLSDVKPCFQKAPEPAPTALSVACRIWGSGHALKKHNGFCQGVAGVLPFPFFGSKW